MGMPTVQIGQSINQQSPQGKGEASVSPSSNNAPIIQEVPRGKGNTTNSATSGQPQVGQPNIYSNTVGPWDNSSTQPQIQSGKGKGH